MCNESKCGVRTNIGVIPLEDYYEIKANQYGYDSYEDLRADGLYIEKPSQKDLVYLS